jgi:hypothetical protein
LRSEASELALLKLLNEQPTVREDLPLISIQNASASRTIGAAVIQAREDETGAE